ncbi:MAG: DnaJ domain-containing protein [Desulfobacteraceae bacterium]|jgi:DnaJ like chaperone protein
MKWIWIILALIYLLSPWDLIPGLHALGWLDDLVIIALLFRYLSKIGQFRTPGPPPFGDRQYTDDQSHTNSSQAAEKTVRTPFEILNIPPDADQKEIRAAYRKLASQYHPDKVAHLGDEFQKLAEQRFKEIQAAYDKLINS